MEDSDKGLELEIAEWLPKREDRLFVPSGTGARLDALGLTGRGQQRNPVGRWQLYADGFLEAGDRLVGGSQGMPYQDALIYPILNLYRHHLELELKYVVRCCPRGQDLREWLTRTHRLKVLWDKMARVYPRFGVWASPECTQACYALLLELDGLDPDSQSSRYPTDRRDNQTLLGLEIVDLPTLKAGVHKISHYLGTIIEQIGEDRDWEEEMNSW